MSTNLNLNTGGYPMTATEAQQARQLQVPEAFDVLEKSVATQEELCTELQKRLDGVLRNEPEAAEGSGQSEPKRTVVGVASRLNGISDRLHRLANSYNSILRRLEL